MNKPLVAAPASEQPREAPHQRDSVGQFLFLVCRLRIGDGGHHLWSQASGPSPPKAARSRSSSTRAASAESLTLQQLRAVERGRGRDARTPSQIPWRGWKDVVVRTYRRIQDNRVLAVAAGVAFYSLVALFPAIAAGVSSYALFANVATISKHLSIASDIIPAGSLDLWSAEITRIAAKSDGKLTFGFLLGLGIALWSSNAGMKAIFDALNIIYDEDDKRGLIWLNVVSLFFTVCAIAAVGMAISLVVVFPLFLAAFGLTASTIRSSAICAGR